MSLSQSLFHTDEIIIQTKNPPAHLIINTMYVVGMHNGQRFDNLCAITIGEKGRTFSKFLFVAILCAYACFLVRKIIVTIIIKE